MRSTQLSLGKYDSDKISSGYLARYDIFFESWIDKPIKLLELGIHRGGSLLLWHDYFPSGTVTGIDIKLPRNFESREGIHLYEGSQTDKAFLSHVARQVAPNGFDIIIDDASHLGEFTKVSFWHLFDNHLKPGGLYVIEDWGTGYWSDWPDGKTISHPTKSTVRVGSRMSNILNKILPKRSLPSHDFGMVGFVKQLIDEQAAPDVTRRSTKGKPTRPSKFYEITITPSMVFVKKTN
jgi:hypothetical protein